MGYVPAGWSGAPSHTIVRWWPPGLPWGATLGVPCRRRRCGRGATLGMVRSGALVRESSLLSPGMVRGSRRPTRRLGSADSASSAQA